MNVISELAKAAKEYTKEARKAKAAADSGNAMFDHRAYVAAEIALHVAAINFAELVMEKK
jgi:hypothetical protein